MQEFTLLKHIFSTTGAGAAGVVVGPGDDMAVLEAGGRRLLAAIDQVVAGCHFDADRTPVGLIGRKAVARSVSDIAAMAGVPLAALAAVVLPTGYGERNATALFDAMHEAARGFGCPLVGGDIAIASGQHLSCSVAVLAEPGPAGAILRSGARPGDVLYVTGALGGMQSSH